MITAAVGLGLVIGLAVAGAGIYEAGVDDDGVAGLDQPALHEAISRRTATNTRLLTWFTHLGGPVGMTIIASLITLGMLWRWRSSTPLILMVIARRRVPDPHCGREGGGRSGPAPLSDAAPPYEYAFSCPSCKAVNSTVIAGLLAYLLLGRLRHRWARVVTVIVAVAGAVAMGSQPGVPRSPLADRRRGRLDAGRRLAGAARHGHRLFLTRRRARSPAGSDACLDGAAQLCCARLGAVIRCDLTGPSRSGRGG